MQVFPPLLLRENGIYHRFFTLYQKVTHPNIYQSRSGTNDLVRCGISRTQSQRVVLPLHGLRCLRCQAIVLNPFEEQLCGGCIFIIVHASSIDIRQLLIETTL